MSKQGNVSSDCRKTDIPDSKAEAASIPLDCFLLRFENKKYFSSLILHPSYLYCMSVAQKIWQGFVGESTTLSIRVIL
jgi:hypothetical protein